MFINLSEWKMIKVFSTVDCIKPKNLAKSFNNLSDDNLRKTLDSLVHKDIVNYFWIGGGYNDYSSYNIKSLGMKIAKRAYLKHNVIEFFVVLDKNKAWIPNVAGLTGLSIAVKKC